MICWLVRTKSSTSFQERKTKPSLPQGTMGSLRAGTSARGAPVMGKFPRFSARCVIFFFLSLFFNIVWNCDIYIGACTLVCNLMDFKNLSMSMQLASRRRHGHVWSQKSAGAPFQSLPKPQPRVLLVTFNSIDCILLLFFSP